MKALALTFPGLSDVCATEIKQLIGKTCKELSEAALFEADPEDIIAVCYRAQSVIRVILVLSEGTAEELSVPKEYLTGTISVDAKSTTKANEIAARIPAQKVYKNADIPLYAHNEGAHWWLGIDLTGDIGKRDYRIFIGSEVLTGPTAFGVLQLAGYEPKHTLLDPVCRAGTIAIEAALSAAHFPVRSYSKDKIRFKLLKFDDTVFTKHDKKIRETTGTIIALSEQFPHVQAARKNAKIAGIIKAIDFSRTETEWLDIKFEKNSIDRIVTQPIEFNTTFPVEKAKKIASLFFERASAILKKNGTIGLVLRQGKDEYLAAAQQKFSLDHERIIMQGKEAWNVLVFSRT